MNTLPSTALIARLHIKMLGNRQKDDTLTHEVHARHGMAADAGLYQKCPLPEACFAHLRKVAHNARREHRQRTFQTDYGSILPAVKVSDYLEAMQPREQEWDAAVARFIREYPRNLELARRRLNGSFREKDYPVVTELPRLFHFETVMLPLPTDDALDQIAGLADDRVQQMRAQLQQTASNAANAAREQLLGRILDRVQQIGNALANPEARITSTALDRFGRLLDDAASLNLTQDPGITRLVSDCRRHLTLAAESLRNDPAVRTRTLAAASLLLRNHGRHIETPAAA